MKSVVLSLAHWTDNSASAILFLLEFSFHVFDILEFPYMAESFGDVFFEHSLDDLFFLIKHAEPAYHDLLAEWLDECCVLEPTASAKVGDLWESWEGFARRRGMLNYIRSSTALGRRLESRFPAEKGAKGVRMRLGIGLRAVDDVF